MFFRFLFVLLCCCGAVLFLLSSIICSYKQLLLGSLRRGQSFCGASNHYFSCNFGTCYLINFKMLILAQEKPHPANPPHCGCGFPTKLDVFFKICHVILFLLLYCWFVLVFRCFVAVFVVVAVFACVCLCLFMCVCVFGLICCVLCFINVV